MKKGLVIVIIVGVLVLAGIYAFQGMYESRIERQAESYEPALDGNEQIEEEIIAVEESPPVSPPQESKPVLSGFGLNIEPFNAQTKKAGDLIFTKDLLFDDGHVDNDKVFVDFGHKDKYRKDSIGNIEYWFHVPLNTPVKSPLAGKIEISYIKHTKDWAVSIKQTNHEYIFSFEHVVNLKVKEGDYVNVGDILGDASPRNTFNNKIAMVELAVWKGGNRIEKFCPFNFLREDLKPMYAEKINTLASDWETFIGKDVYQQENWVSPGCLVDMIFET